VREIYKTTEKYEEYDASGWRVVDTVSNDSMWRIVRIQRPQEGWSEWTWSVSGRGSKRWHGVKRWKQAQGNGFLP
jgi:hypothetical protein